MYARELWFTGPHGIELRNGAVPRLGPGQVLVKALASGVSQGTELMLFRGEGPTTFDPSLDGQGQPTYPRRYGYAWVGEVVECDKDVRAVDVGDRVFALAPHGDWHAMEAEHVRRIGTGIPPARAVLAANIETAVNCIWDSQVSIGDSVVVLGAGTVGLLLTHWLNEIGATVNVVEPSARRRALAQSLGATIAVPGEEALPPSNADIVFEATGHPAALDDAIRLAATEATIVIVSFYGLRRHPIDLGDAFHRKRLTIRSSQVSRIAPGRAVRWSKDRRFELVKDLLNRTVLDGLLDESIDFGEAPETYRCLDAAHGDFLQTVFTY